MQLDYPPDRRMLCALRLETHGQPDGAHFRRDRDEAIGRPQWPRMPCGWGCRAQLTGLNMREAASSLRSHGPTSEEQAGTPTGSWDAAHLELRRAAHSACRAAEATSRPIARRYQPIIAQPIHKEAPPGGLSRFFWVSLASLNRHSYGDVNNLQWGDSGRRALGSRLADVFPVVLKVVLKAQVESVGTVQAIGLDCPSPEASRHGRAILLTIALLLYPSVCSPFMRIRIFRRSGSLRSRMEFKIEVR
jgi:hypothetical protein